MHKLGVRVMRRKILISLLVALGIAITLISPLAIGVPALIIWIYLIREVWKQRKKELKDQIEKGISESHLKRLQVLLKVAGAALIVFIVGSVFHNVISGLYEIEESISLIIAIAGLLLFVAATAVGFLTYIRGRRNVE